MRARQPFTLTLKRSALLAATVSLALGGCQSLGPMNPSGGSELLGHASSQGVVSGLYSRIPQEKLTSATRKYAAEGIKALDERDYTKASDSFNQAVKTDITSSQLHFLNAFAYHQRARQGESGLFPLAEQGYEQAVQFDPTNWVARYYRGLMYLDQRDYPRAQASLAEAALYTTNDPDLLYSLAVASYYAKDPKTAATALERLRALYNGKPDDARTMRAAAIVHAALNQPDEAREYAGRFRKVAVNPGEADWVEQRTNSWNDLYSRGKVQLAQFGAPAAPGGAPGAPGAAGAKPGAFPGLQAAAPRGPSDFVETQMALVDVVILSTEEDNTTAMGVNLLQGLRIQFGNPAAGTAAFSRARSNTFDNLNRGNDVNTRVITRLISIPANTYTLNIANSNSRNSEVVARPTLVALGGQPSQFFSGTDIVGAAVSGGLGSAVQIQKEVGIRLGVLPEFLPDNLIKLQVTAERTFLTNPSSNVVFDFRLDTTKTLVSANVVMRYGETLILSGLTERNRDRNRDGVPLLQDIPLFQYLFSRRDTRDVFRSVLVLLTPRRAEYTNRAEGVVAAEREKMSVEERAVEEFNDKQAVKQQVAPNTRAIWELLDTSTLGREFRTGDLGISNWTGQKEHAERLRSVVDFLYY